MLTQSTCCLIRSTISAKKECSRCSRSIPALATSKMRSRTQNCCLMFPRRSWVARSGSRTQGQVVRIIYLVEWQRIKRSRTKFRNSQSQVLWMETLTHETQFAAIRNHDSNNRSQVWWTRRLLCLTENSKSQGLMPVYALVPAAIIWEVLTRGWARLRERSVRRRQVESKMISGKSKKATWKMSPFSRTSSGPQSTRTLLI